MRFAFPASARPIRTRNLDSKAAEPSPRGELQRRRPVFIASPASPQPPLSLHPQESSFISLSPTMAGHPLFLQRFALRHEGNTRIRCYLEVNKFRGNLQCISPYTLRQREPPNAEMYLGLSQRYWEYPLSS